MYGAMLYCIPFSTLGADFTILVSHPARLSSEACHTASCVSCEILFYSVGSLLTSWSGTRFCIVPRLAAPAISALPVVTHQQR